jgi:Uma2 family endonuclease
MMTTTLEPIQKPISADEYLALQHAGGREDAPKYEFVNQKLVLKNGESLSHNRIYRNVITVLGLQTWKTGNIEVFGNDMRVVSHVPVKNYFYPDVVIAQGKLYFDEDAYKETLMNPTAIIEILSKTTEGLDRGDKFKSFRLTKSVREYILVNQYEACIEHYYRDENDTWQFGEIYTEGVFRLNTQPLELDFTDVYRNVDFDDPNATKDPDELVA